MKFKDIQATIHLDFKARKEGLSVREISKNDEIWHEFYKRYKETCRRGGILPFSIDEIKESKLFICEKGGMIIAGATIKEKREDEKIELFINASIYEYLKFQPNNLLYWNFIKYGKNQGFKIFDLGGYQLKAPKGSKLYEINRFKERWGGEIITYYIYSKNPLYILGRKIIRNFPFVKKIRDKLRIVFG
jgi:lipid II:glycine glycyltransferase (peptidoglycan interpeptide bridge formation enzyme)